MPIANLIDQRRVRVRARIRCRVVYYVTNYTTYSIQQFASERTLVCCLHKMLHTERGIRAYVCTTIPTYGRVLRVASRDCVVVV